MADKISMSQRALQEVMSQQYLKSAIYPSQCNVEKTTEMDCIIMTGASLRLNPGDKSYRAILSRSAVCSSVFLQNGIWDFFQFCLVNTFSIIRDRVKAGLSAVEKNSYCRKFNPEMSF